MSYKTQNAIATNASINNRCAQAVATESDAVGDQDRWVYEHRRDIAAAPGWDAAWESALVAHPEPEYDPGADEGVITDGMILSQIQSMVETPE